jgi:hypothetical protein
LEVGESSGTDPETLAYMDAQIEAINRALKQNGLPAHREPPLPSGSGWSGDMFGYSGLHYLRRLAAHLDRGLPLPPPGDDSAPEDPILAQYHQTAERPQPGLLGRLFAPKSPFRRQYDHLLIHGDAEGYYLPIDFPTVLFVDDAEVAGGMIGSSVRLLQECRQLATAIGLPHDLDPEADELWEAADAQGEAQSGWQRYGVEAFTCCRLMKAAEVSVNLKAMIVFC